MDTSSIDTSVIGNVLINIAMVVEYDGSRFCGFQKQLQGVRTIQGELELALSTFANERVDIITSGRTDTGVHATYQVINFKTRVKRPLASWVRATNSLLPNDIVIRDAVIAEDSFHARFALNRTYHYYVVVEPTRPAILRGKVGWCYTPLNIDSMVIAQQTLLGEKDFTSFRAAGCQAKNPVRNMTSVGISKRDKLIRFEFTANAFLYHMVRNMVGALVFVGKGALAISEFTQIFDSCSRKYAPPTFMPDGLYLVGVEYPNIKFDYTKPDWIY